MRCHVYRCPRRAGTYLYLAERDAFERVPAELQAQFGRPEFVFEVDLVPGRGLAHADPAAVRDNLSAHGFHLQLPPSTVDHAG